MAGEIGSYIDRISVTDSNGTSTAYLIDTQSGFVKTDTKNTAGATDTSSKIYLVGALSQVASSQTYTHDTVYVNTSGQLVASTPASTTNDTTVATTAFVKAQGYTTNTGTVTSVGLVNATDGGMSITGSPVTGSGSITVGHTNVLTSSQATQAVYPITIDKNGHIASYGTAVTIPTVNDASLTFKKGTSTVGSFTANASNNLTITYSTSSISPVTSKNVIKLAYANSGVLTFVSDDSISLGTAVTVLTDISAS